MPTLAATSGLRIAAALVALAFAGPAHAQMPVKQPSSPSDTLPPMPAPIPVNGTPPDMRGVGPAPAGSVTAPTHVPAPPPETAPAPLDASPNVPATAASAAAPDAVAVTPPSRPRAWGEGTTLIRRGAKIGVYIAPTFTLASINRSPGFMLGADFGVLLGERFSIGVAGKALVTPLAALRSDGRTFNLRLPYAGVTLAVALVRVKFFTIGVSTLLGGGRVCLNDERLDRCVNRAAMFVAEPELGLQFAVTKFLRLVISGGYRVVVSQAWSGPDRGLLSGMSGTLALRLGKF